DKGLVNHEAEAVCSLLHLGLGERVELERFDDLAEDRLEGSRSDPTALEGLLRDLAYGSLADLQLDGVVAEKLLGGPEHRVLRLHEDAAQGARVKVFEDDGVVEAGQELGLHPVVEQVLLPEVVLEG